MTQDKLWYRLEDKLSETCPVFFTFDRMVEYLKSRDLTEYWYRGENQLCKFPKRIRYRIVPQEDGSQVLTHELERYL